MPQVFQVSEIARPAYYDRQAIPIFGSFGGVFTTHASVIRWTYTPVNGAAAFIETLLVQLIVQTVAGTFAGSTVAIEFLPFYGGTVGIIGASQLGNVQYVKDNQTLSSAGYMAYGDTIRAYSFNSNTGGVNIMNALMKATEFVY